MGRGKHGVRIPEPIPVFDDSYAITITDGDSDPDEQRFVDQDAVNRFLDMAEASGGGSGYQTLINAALREYLDGKSPTAEDTLRHIIREELKSNGA